jgi:hypothetical protein
MSAQPVADSFGSSFLTGIIASASVFVWGAATTSR